MRFVSFLCLAMSACELDAWHKTEAFDADCSTNAAYFESSVQQPILLPICANCHTQSGAASGTRFILVNDDSSAGQQYNYAAVSKLAKITENGVSLLLLKPEQLVSHGGGLQLPTSSPLFTQMQNMVQRIEACPAQDAQASVATTTPVAPVNLPPRIRLLNRDQYNNTVAALLGDTSLAANAFPPDEPQSEYTNNAAQTSGTLLTSLFVSTAQSLATADYQNPAVTALLPCAYTSGTTVCAQQFIAAFAKKAYRRPLTDDDANDLLTVYQTAIDNGASFATAMQTVIGAVLMAPSFLYLTEIGDGTSSGPDISLTPYEIASEISYVVTNGPPDDALLAAADANQLTSSAQIQAQVQRLLQSDAAQSQVATFFEEWIEAAQLLGTTKDATLYPNFAALRQSMLNETDAFVTDVTFNGDGSLTTLMTAPYTFVDQNLANFYGLGLNVPAGTMQKASLAGTGRSGLFMQAAFLSVHGDSELSSPIKRGVFVRRRLLCENLPDPPPGLNVNPPTEAGDLTTRQLFDQHMSSPTCSGCHILINPVGNGFENFDTTGAYRTIDNGQPVDASGEVAGTVDANGSFQNAAGLMGLLDNSSDVKNCFARNFFRYASGQSDPATEQRFMDTLGDNVPDSTLDLINSFTQSAVFSTRTVAP